MTLEQVIKAIENIKKGSFIKCEFKTIKKPYAAYKDYVIEKSSVGVYRLGIGYYNIEHNKEKERIASTKGGFVMGYQNYLFETIDKQGNKHYCLRVYTTNHKPTTRYFMNGQETTKEYLKDNKVIPFYESKPIDCFDIRIENIISLGAY